MRLADDFAGSGAGARPTGREQRDLWFQAYRAAFMGATRCPTIRSSSAQYDRAREFFLDATALEDPPLEVDRAPV